ncbi:MAG: FAD-dependent oxidoreductase [Planctomycetota bacterium]
MDFRVIVIGGGLSGLSASWMLHRHGVETVLLEARSRLGGRALSIRVDNEPFDMGPSWIWLGQPCVHGLLEHFGIETFEQFCEGDLLHQGVSGKILRNPHLKPMQGSLRIAGGVDRLVQSLVNEIPLDSIRTDHSVAKIESSESDESKHGGVTVFGEGPEGPFSIQGNAVGLALPLRISAKLKFSPPLQRSGIEAMEATPHGWPDMQNF